MYYGMLLVIKKNEVMTLAGKQMELKMVIVSEVTQSQKHNHWFSLKTFTFDSSDMST